MTTLSRLGLGTVQFGLDYGVSNRVGCPDEEEVATILKRAAESKIGYIDTAPVYGKAEVLVGRHLPSGHMLRIVTKTPPIAEAKIEARHGVILLESLAGSLERLKVDALHGLLVHQAGDLAKPGWQHIVEALAEARARGWVGRTGASVYDAGQLALVESRFRPELVQLPLSALDRRPVASGMLARLKAAGTEIHVRSIFLQGVLLMLPDEIPEFFAAVRKEIVGLHSRWREQGLSAIAGCLTFALQQPEIDAVIVGVNRRSELNEIIAAATSVAPAVIDFGPAPNIDPIYLNPSRWPVSAS